ncbi:MAG: hypothetical protein LIO86_09750 [Lachnospiraceae bacterium]|nr:hypothetical protein [Lachnospiraceae bacterium]
MGRKEEPLVKYYENAEHFAELMNGWLYAGSRILTSEQVQARNIRYTGKTGKGRATRYRSRYRDIVKYVDGLHPRL